MHSPETDLRWNSFELTSEENDFCNRTNALVKSLTGMSVSLVFISRAMGY